MNSCLYRIVHISDLHIMRNRGLVHNLVDTHHACQNIIAEINALERQPDMVVVSGDLSNGGDEEETEKARSFLDNLTAPYIVCLGNHDDRMVVATEFGLTNGKEMPYGLVHQSIADCAWGRLRFLVLDTVVQDPIKSGLSSLQLDWLESQLAEDPEMPTIIVMHHPPFDTGIGWLDSMGLSFGREKFAAILRKNRRIVCILCGHLHRPMCANWCGVWAYAGPSVMSPVEVAKLPHELAPGDVPQLRISGPPGFALYDLSPKCEISNELRFLSGTRMSWQDVTDKNHLWTI